ncbi:hypothetical protein ROHU_003936 [Labeo rohita]|uniref:Uncharacterized protein n=1 Tax=Labeo rohita TaxID=84645 RepID=A0A498NSB0_LABRO|nr:hypothetical protein ROHU_003936 [Labeo rohita]
MQQRARLEDPAECWWPERRPRQRLEEQQDPRYPRNIPQFRSRTCFEAIGRANAEKTRDKGESVVENTLDSEHYRGWLTEVVGITSI